MLFKSQIVTSNEDKKGNSSAERYYYTQKTYLYQLRNDRPHFLGFIETRMVMAKSTYISENLTENQLAFLKYLDGHEIMYFKLSDLAIQLPESFSNINELAENLCQKGLLNRVERGVYARVNYINLRVLATFICPNSAIGYWSALHHHGLTERFPSTVFVKSTHRKKDAYILGTSVKFIAIKHNKNRGVIQVGYGDNIYSVTNIEMTFMDCFDQPRYAGDFADLIKAFANTKLRNNQLIEYAKAYNNIALIKRMGFLAELFQNNTLKSFINFAKRRVNKRYNLIDSGGMEQGEFVSDWKLRLNVSKENLIQIAQTEY